ncbi:MAG: hypothetical protein ACLGI6_02410 [Gammaproteobacteria bacterium]
MESTVVSGKGRRTFAADIARLMLAVMLLLLVPLAAMQFTHEVAWNGFDFAVAGVLLTIAGMLCLLVVRTVRTRRRRIWLVSALGAGFVLVWLELAVGVVGSPLGGS